MFTNNQLVSIDGAIHLFGDTMIFSNYSWLIVVFRITAFPRFIFLKSKLD